MYINTAWLLRIISRVISASLLKNGGFFFMATGLAIEVNCHFLENEYGDQSVFYVGSIQKHSLETWI